MDLGPERPPLPRSLAPLPYIMVSPSIRILETFLLHSHGRFVIFNPAVYTSPWFVQRRYTFALLRSQRLRQCEVEWDRSLSSLVRLCNYANMMREVTLFYYLQMMGWDRSGLNNAPRALPGLPHVNRSRRPERI